MSKYEAVYFVGDNQAINRVRIDSSKTRNRGAFSGSLAALLLTQAYKGMGYSRPLRRTVGGGGGWHKAFECSTA